MQIHFLGGATTVTGSQYLLETDACPGAHRLRHVPGQPQRVHPQPDPVRLRSGRPRRRPADPRPPRPLRAAPAAGQGGLHGADPRDGRHDRAGDAGAPRLGQAPRGVRQARGPLGEAPSGPRRRGRPQGGGRLRGGPRDRRIRGRLARAGRRGRGSDPAGRRPPRPTPSTSPTTVEPVAPASWPRDPEADLRAQPPHLAIDLDEPLYTAQRRRADAQPLPAGSIRRGDRGGTRRAWRPTWMPGTSSARPSSGCGSRNTRAARNGSSSSPATSDGPGRRSCATRRR